MTIRKTQSVRCDNKQDAVPPIIFFPKPGFPGETRTSLMSTHFRPEDSYVFVCYSGNALMPFTSWLRRHSLKRPATPPQFVIMLVSSRPKWCTHVPNKGANICAKKMQQHSSFSSSSATCWRIMSATRNHISIQIGCAIEGYRNVFCNSLWQKLVFF